MPVPIRPCIAAVPDYKAGKPPAPGPDGLGFKLSSNENPYPPLPSVLRAAQQAAEGMNRYPDAGNAALTQAVAERFGVKAEQLAFGTGSVAVLYHLLQALCAPGDEVVYAWRSFEAYPIAVQLVDARPVGVPLTADGRHDLAAMRAAITERTRVVLVCTPNNPTGPTVGHDELVAFLDDVPDDVLVIVDEAYVEFVTDPAAARGLDASGLLDGSRDNVAVLRTFSKAYGLAGFRVGFCLAPEPVAAAARATALPFGVSSVASAAAVASLAAEAELFDRVHALVAERTILLAGLRDRGLDVPDAQGNFVWLPSGARTSAWAEEFATAGLAIRPFAPGDGTDGIRISVGEPEANRRVLAVAERLARA